MRLFVKFLAVLVAAVLADCAGSGPGHDLSPDEILAAAKAGDAKAAFFAYRQATTMPERRKWICIAANRKLPEAQSEIARLHWPYPGAPTSPFSRDAFKAYVWTVIAVRNHEPLEYMEKRLRLLVPEDERWQAAIMATSWQPDPAQCEDIANSEFFNVDLASY